MHIADFSTFVVLYLVPCLYLALDDIGERRWRRSVPTKALGFSAGGS